MAKGICKHCGKPIVKPTGQGWRHYRGPSACPVTYAEPKRAARRRCPDCSHTNEDDEHCSGLGHPREDEDPRGGVYTDAEGWSPQ